MIKPVFPNVVNWRPSAHLDEVPWRDAIHLALLVEQINDIMHLYLDRSPLILYSNCMKHVPQQTVRKFVTACHDVAAHGLVRCSSGNMSLRLDKQHMLIKGSRSWMGNITTGDVCVCRISDGALLSGKKASVEAGFHAGILRTRPDVNVVLHFQSPYATAMACRKNGKTNFFVIPEIPFYIGEVARIPYIDPGSRKLASAVTRAMQRHDMVLMGNHGQTTVAADFDHAIQNAEFIELACEIIIRGGTSVRPISPTQAKHLLALKRASTPASV